MNVRCHRGCGGQAENRDGCAAISVSRACIAAKNRSASALLAPF